MNFCFPSNWSRKIAYFHMSTKETKVSQGSVALACFYNPLMSVEKNLIVELKSTEFDVFENCNTYSFYENTEVFP